MNELSREIVESWILDSFDFEKLKEDIKLPTDFILSFSHDDPDFDYLEDGKGKYCSCALSKEGLYVCAIGNNHLFSVPVLEKLREYSERKLRFGFIPDSENSMAMILLYRSENIEEIQAMIEKELDQVASKSLLEYLGWNYR